MAGINFNPQPMNNWKSTPKSKEDNNQQPPETGNINDFMNTKEGQAFLATFKKNKANQPQPANNGTVKGNNNNQQPPAPSINPKLAEPKDQEAPKTSDINDFMNTAQGQYLLATYKKNKANQPQPANNGTVKGGNNNQPPKGPYLG